jgi:predicted glycoside hydrolase/deacetylase ChbG (UPF0249 family)
VLIINADDWGFNRYVTDRIMAVNGEGRITSTSGMVFMEDSERAADLALNRGLEVGLHLNFTDHFTDGKTSSGLHERQQKISRFLKKNKYFLILYNPFLRREFEYVYRTQYDEFIRLYGKAPADVTGHRHMHLCSNMLIGKLIHQNCKVRRNFSFSSGDKTWFNMLYRKVVDICLKKRFICTDYFFSIAPVSDPRHLGRILKLSESSIVEMMVHPQNPDEYKCLMSDRYMQLLNMVKIGKYGDL